MNDKKESLQLPTWFVGILIGLLISMAGVIFTAGGTYVTVQQIGNRLEKLEQRFNQWEENQNLRGGQQRGH